MSIKVVGFKWKQKMLIAGHYEFEIVIKKKDVETTIFRRFSEIEWLHEGLIKENPGCRILPLPEKNMWCNLNINNSQELEKRQQSIETYLNYIHDHKYLYRNSYYLQFISQNFSLSKAKNESNQTGLFDSNKSSEPSSGLMGTVYGFTSYLPSIPYFGSGKSQTKKRGNNNNDNNPENIELNKDKEKLERLLTGLKDLIENIKKHLEVNEKKTQAIGSLVDLAKQMNYKGINYKQLSEENGDDFGTDQSNKQECNQQKNLEQNLEMLTSYYRKSMDYKNKLDSNILTRLKEYKIELEGIIEIFARKKQHDEQLMQLEDKKEDKNSDGTNIENAIEIKKEFIGNLIQQLKYEIDKFQTMNESKLITIIKDFYIDKYEKDMEIAEFFEKPQKCE